MTKSPVVTFTEEIHNAKLHCAVQVADKTRQVMVEPQGNDFYSDLTSAEAFVEHFQGALMHLSSIYELF